MHAHYACGSSEHFSRRSFLEGTTAGALSAFGFSQMNSVQASETLKKQRKQVVVFWLAGGVSQLETWDPKPGAQNGGPFQAIPTSVPGVHICELLPETARHIHHLAVVRGINTKENNHGKGAYIMQTGHRQTPGFDYPYIGSAFASLLQPDESPLPAYMTIGRNGNPTEASFLGPKFAPLNLPDGKAPPNLDLPAGLSIEADRRRRKLRQAVSMRFQLGRRQAFTEIYDSSHEQAAALMTRKDIFDFGSIPSEEAERYGKHDFGRHCLMARKLVEEGITFVKVNHTNYDTHSENFNFHIEQLGEFDKPFATFLGDLEARRLLDSTLVIVMCEFGRTPRINQRVGRDHWGTAWSIAVGGCGIKGGAVVGKTNDEGTQVIDREVNGGHLFHTYYKAVGLDSQEPFIHNGRPFEKATPETTAIQEILA